MSGWLILGVLYALMLVFVWALAAAAALGDELMAAASMEGDDE